jgi:hypothetical protein
MSSLFLLRSFLLLPQESLGKEYQFFLSFTFTPYHLLLPSGNLSPSSYKERYNPSQCLNKGRGEMRRISMKSGKYGGNGQ